MLKLVSLSRGMVDLRMGTGRLRDIGVVPLEGILQDGQGVGIERDGWPVECQ